MGKFFLKKNPFPFFWKKLWVKYIHSQAMSVPLDTQYDRFVF